MLEQHPGGVREPVGLHAAQLLRHVLHDVVKAGVSASAVEQVEHMLAELFVVRIFGLPFRPPYDSPLQAVSESLKLNSSSSVSLMHLW